MSRKMTTEQEARKRQETLEARLRLWALTNDEQIPIDKALIQVFPGHKSRPRTFRGWEDSGLWPPSQEEIASLTAPEANTVQQSQPPPDVDIHRTSSQTESHTSELGQDSGGPGLTDAEILARAKAILMEDIEPAKRPLTAPGRESTLATKPVAARFPEDLLKELKALGEPVSHHLERAVRLYLKMMKEGK